jgi:hypothetical protein
VNRPRSSPALAALAALVLGTTTARGVDEIQVYSAEINRPRQFSLQLHGNYVWGGSMEPEFPGGLVPDGTFNGTPEFAYGLADWWEVGAYLPYAIASGDGFEWGGAKLRTLFVSPHAAERRFSYGVNLELSWSTDEFSQGSWGSEVRPILSWRWPRVEFLINPILDIPLSGPDRDVVFTPAARLAWIASPAWSFGLEHYAEMGPVDDLLPLDEQLQELFAVADFSGRSFSANFGIGRGLTPASADWTAKYILGWSF